MDFTFKLQELDNVVTWNPYKFDGTNEPRYGVLCKWQWGTIDYYDPIKHGKMLEGIRFVEDDESRSRRLRTVRQDDGNSYIDDLGGLVCTF